MTVNACGGYLGGPKARLARRVLWLALAWSCPALAAEVELRLVVHDDPATTVDAKERSREITNPVATDRGVVIRKIGVDMVCWARNVLLDGAPVFERYHKGKYIDRLPRAKRSLAPGRHTLWPGDHAFTVAADGRVTTEDPELLVDGAVVSLKCYPVTIRAFRANPAEGDLPMSMRVAPLPDMTLRDAADHEAASAPPERGRKRGKARELLPVFEDFAPLTIWLPAHAAGTGYVLHPVGLTFHLARGRVITGAGGGRAVPGVRVSGTRGDGTRDDGTRVGGARIDIPLYIYPVRGEVGTKAIVSGVQAIRFGGRDRGATKYAKWFPRHDAYEVRVADAGPFLAVSGDLTKRPRKHFAIDFSDPARGLERALAVETDTRHLKAGETLRARVQAVAPAPATSGEGDTASGGAADLLADAGRFARLQAYGGTTWTEVAVKKAGDDEYDLSVPSLADGVYRLRVGVAAKGGRPIHADQWVSLAAPRRMSAGLFTARGRTAFVRGEPFWLGLGVIAVGAPVAARTPVRIELVDERGTRIPLLETRVGSEVAARATLVARLDAEASARLAPGEYRAEASVGDYRARPLALWIAEPEPKTHFINMMNGKYSAQNKIYETVLRTGAHAETLARDLVETGYNCFMGMSYDMDRVARRNVEIEQIVRERPELGPWESYYQPSGRDRFLDACVRQGLRFWENMVTYNDTMLPYDTKIQEATGRYCALEAASMYHSPAFQGVCMYDEIYNGYVQQGIPEGLMQSFNRWYELEYRRRNPKLTTARAAKALERFCGRPAGQRDYADLEAYRTLPRFADSLWEDFSLLGAGAVKRFWSGSMNFTLHRFWGGNGGDLFVNGVATGVSRPFEIAACVMYKDGGSGDRPEFAPMLADVLRVRDDLTVTTQLHGFGSGGEFGKHIMRQAFFALSQKTDGFTFFTLPHSPLSPSQFDNRDPIRDITRELTTPYGDLFLACDKGYRKVAIYASRTLDHLTVRKPRSIAPACEGLWVACARAGYPADFLYDEHVLAGKAKEYDVLFVPGVAFEDEVPPDVLAALRGFVDAGKLLVVERSSKLPVEGVVRADSEFDEYDPRTGAFPRYVDFESEMIWDRSVETAETVRKLLASRGVPPAAEHDLLVGPDWLRCGQGRYMLLPNFAFTEWTGLYKTLYQAPDRPTLRFPSRPPVCYDVLAMRRHPVEVEGDWMSLAADMRHVPGAFFAFLPAEIERVRLGATRSLSAGETLQYRVAAEDAQGGTIDAGVPFEITLRDAGGAAVHTIYRAGIPTYAGAYVVPANAATGRWKVRARELLSGRVAEAEVEVEPGELPSARLDSEAVWLNQKELVTSFLRADETILIVVDDGQEWVRPHAGELAERLVARGRKARVAPLADALRVANDWRGDDPEIDGSRLWRGTLVAPGLFVDAPCVVMGRRNDHRLIEALQRRDLLPECVSESFPGPGRAVVRWVPWAFSNRHDTVAILANDGAGLARGVDALLDPGAVAEAPPVHPAVRTAEVDAEAPVEPGIPAAAAPSDFRARVNLEEPVVAIDSDAATGRVVVGTRGYGENLFCFDADGKLLWKTFLPEFDVYVARWYEGGKKIVAATGRGFRVFLLDAATGRVFRKFASTEYPRFHGYWTNGGEGAIETRVRIVVNPPARQILIGGLTGVMAVSYEGERMWFLDRGRAIAEVPPEVESSGGAGAYQESVSVGHFAPSPDGRRVAYSEFAKVGSTEINKQIVPVWAHHPHVLDAATGRVILRNTDDPGNQTSPAGWELDWPEGASLPFVRTGDLEAPLLEGGKLGAFEHRPGERLKNGNRLARGVTGVRLLDPRGAPLWEIAGPEIWIPGLDRLSDDQTRLYRCDRDGRVRCIDASRGAVLWEHELPFSARLHPLADGVIAGCGDGTLVRLDEAGAVRWSTILREHHEVPSGGYPDYVRAALRRDPDATGEFFHVGEDAPGDYDRVLRMGLEQLTNGGFESDGGWTAPTGELALAGPARSGARALRLADGQLVTQRLARRVIPSATYLLEFHYRLDKVDDADGVDGAGARLTAGAMLSGDGGDSLTASRFAAAPGAWRFGRLAVKSMAGTDAMDVGFEAAGGGVLVDEVSFRPVRFPSANMLACDELHAIEPTFVRDFRVSYDRVPGELKKKLMGRSHVAAYKQGGTTTARTLFEEQAFLHNGRLDDVGKRWVYNPDPMGFSVVLAKAAHVSHLALYFNNAAPENVYGFLSILAGNPEKKRDELAAFVRGNRRRFVVVRFDPPVQTDHLKILPGRHPGGEDCLTEVEVYGPLGGPEMAARGKSFPADPLATPMFMSAPSHVRAVPHADLTGALEEVPRSHHRFGPSFHSGITAVDRAFTVTDAAGAVREFRLPAEAGARKDRRSDPRLQGGRTWQLGTITPTTTPARYAGRLIAGTADGKMHAVADDGTYLWGFASAGRVYSSPAPDGDDVYFGSDDGKLYKVDVDSGILIWEYATGGKVRAAPALSGGVVFASSWDGRLYAVDAEAGTLRWKAEIAPFTRASAAVAGGRVYLGDEKGVMACFEARDGSRLWSAALGGHISACPAVTGDEVFFASDSGGMAVVKADGSVVWRRSLGSRITGQPVATASQVLVPHEKGLAVLRRSDGRADDRVTPPSSPGQVLGVVPYGRAVCILAGGASTRVSGTRSYAGYHGVPVLWVPKGSGRKP